MGQHEEAVQKKRAADTVAFLSSMAKDIHKIQIHTEAKTKLEYLQLLDKRGIIGYDDYICELTKIGSTLGYRLSTDALDTDV